MKAASVLYRLFGDEAWLRLLWVLAREWLNVIELIGVLGLVQSGVFCHLGMLKEVGLVEEQCDGGFSYYCAAARAGADAQLIVVFQVQFDVLVLDFLVRADEARLQEVLWLRKENFDVHVGFDICDACQFVLGRSWAVWSRVFGLLMSFVKVVDLGCGEGYLTIEAVRWASRVVVVDRFETVLTRVKALAWWRCVSNVIWKWGEFEKVSMKDASVDIVMLLQVLHHAHDPARAVVEVVCVITLGGCVLLLDLCAHDEEWVRAKFGDCRLGFADEELRRMLTVVGLVDVKVGVGARKAGDPFMVLIVLGIKAVAKHTKDTKQTRIHDT